MGREETRELTLWRLEELRPFPTSWDQSLGALQTMAPSRLVLLPSGLAVLGQTSTPGFGGTFGQSVPVAVATELISKGAPRSIVAIREDAAFRTNLILSNATSAATGRGLESGG